MRRSPVPASPPQPAGDSLDNGIVCGFMINPNDGDKISTDHSDGGMQSYNKISDKTSPTLAIDENCI